MSNDEEEEEALETWDEDGEYEEDGDEANDGETLAIEVVPFTVKDVISVMYWDEEEWPPPPPIIIPDPEFDPTPPPPAPPYQLLWKGLIDDELKIHLNDSSSEGSASTLQTTDKSAADPSGLEWVGSE